MPLPALPAIAAVIARVAVPVGRALLAAGRGVGAAAKTVGAGALDAGSAIAGSFRAAPAITRSMLGGTQQPMAAAARSASSNVPQAVRQTINVNAGAQAAAHHAMPTAATQAASQAQASIASKAAAAQSGASRWMQRGANLYQQAQHDRNRDRQRDRVEMNREMGAGMAALQNHDPKAFAHFAKAAAIGLKGLAATLAGPVGVITFFAMLPKMIRDFGNSLLEARRPLADYSGSIAVAFARLDMQRVGRNVNFGGRVSSTTGELSRAVSQLETRLLPYAAATVNILNRIATIGLDRLDRAVSLLERLPFVEALLDRLGRKDDAGSSSSIAGFAIGLRDGIILPEKDRVKRPLK